MKELSSIEQLENFARKNELEYYTNRDVKKHLVNTGNSFTKYEFLVIDLPKKDKKLHLVFSDTMSSRGAGGFAYCGLFLQIPVCKNEIKIRRRFLIDNLSFTKRHKTSNSFTDKNLTIFKTNNESIPMKIDTRMVKSFLELNKWIGPLEFVSIKKSMSFIPVLHNQHWLAILLNRRWLVEPDKLKLLIKKGSELLNNAKTNI